MPIFFLPTLPISYPELISGVNTEILDERHKLQ